MLVVAAKAGSLLVQRWWQPPVLGELLVLGLAFSFALAFIAELIGLADIIGAFAAGLVKERLLNPDELKARCRVYRLTEDRAGLDFHHPLAGEALTLFIRVRKVLPPARSRLPAVH